MRFDIVTIFPDLFPSFLSYGIMKRAREKGLVSVQVHDLREYTTDRHRSVDDVPYGGGVGMVMKVEPIHRAVTALCRNVTSVKRVLLSPRGRVLDQCMARCLASEEAILLLCGRYEGVDERVREHLVDEEISIGDYVLMGGEIPAMVLMEAVVRLIPDVLGSRESLDEESFSRRLLEYPHYTRPSNYQGWQVPETLLSGNHEHIREWRWRQSLVKTARGRPDLIDWNGLSPREREWLVNEGVCIPEPPLEGKTGEGYD
ncbi:MAG: tRNA (guanosine(37)-N1)-methyltransferase TrmD [bacterium]